MSTNMFAASKTKQNKFENTSKRKKLINNEAWILNKLFFEIM